MAPVNIRSIIKAIISNFFISVFFLFSINLLPLGLLFFSDSYFFDIPKLSKKSLSNIPIAIPPFLKEISSQSKPERKCCLKF
ncbi:MAG TPA: hypothetical protein DCP92_05015 [Nitrospiraceae bacterium]|nr:hypothetical protein [Nitrospiraceae bacterium]